MGFSFFYFLHLDVHRIFLIGLFNQSIVWIAGERLRLQKSGGKIETLSKVLKELYEEVDALPDTEYSRGYLDAIRWIAEWLEEEGYDE